MLLIPPLLNTEYLAPSNPITPAIEAFWDNVNFSYTRPATSEVCEFSRAT